MNWLRHLGRTKPERIAADLLYEARRLLILHEAAAEDHQAQADMYRKRVERLTTQTTIEKEKHQ